MSNYKKLTSDIIGNWNFTNARTTNTFFFFWHRTCPNEIGWAYGRCYEFGHQQRIYGW